MSSVYDILLLSPVVSVLLGVCDITEQLVVGWYSHLAVMLNPVFDMLRGARMYFSTYSS